MSEKNNTASLGWGTRISYGLGDTACNIVFGMITALLTLFYTDYCGIPVVTVGLVMLISRIFDGSSDVIMGIIVSKTKSKWGQGPSVDLVDERTVCSVRGCDVLCAAQQQHDRSILVHFCYL